MVELYFAAEQGDIVRVKQLVNDNVDVNLKYKGSTPLFAAATHNHLEIVNYLLDHKADVNILDNDGYSVLYKTIKECCNDDIARALVNAGADINFIYYSTLLYIAAWNGLVGIIKILIENGADVNQKMKNNGQTALHAAIKIDQVDAMVTLIGLGADIDMVDNMGYSSLHHAVIAYELYNLGAFSNFKLLKTLLTYNPDNTIRDRNGKLAINHVINKNEVRFLLEQYSPLPNTKEPDVEDV